MTSQFKFGSTHGFLTRRKNPLEAVKVSEPAKRLTEYYVS